MVRKARKRGGNAVGREVRQVGGQKECGGGRQQEVLLEVVRRRCHKGHSRAAKVTRVRETKNHSGTCPRISLNS